MKTASAQLISMLRNSTAYLMADLFTFTLSNGQILRYTSADTDLTLAGIPFSSAGPLLTRSSVKLTRGIEVDTLTVTIYAGLQHQLSDMPLIAYVLNGGFDGARLTLQRVFMQSWGDTSLGAVQLFSGRVSQVDGSRSEAQIEVKSDLELLNIKLPSRLYQPACTCTPYDSKCGLNRSTLAVTGTVTQINGRNILTTLTQADAYFDQGALTFISGANSGQSRTVKNYLRTNGTLTLALPFPASIVVGDTFKLLPGCDKTLNTCSNKFGNVIHFRGFPSVPKPETAYS